MSLINKPFPDFQPLTTAESAKVNADFNTLYSEFNGGISDPNISPTAGIQQTKIANLPADLQTKKNVGDVYTATNLNEIAVVNTTQPITIGFIDFPAGVVGIADFFHATSDVFIFGIENFATLTLSYFLVQLPETSNFVTIHQTNVNNQSGFTQFQFGVTAKIRVYNRAQFLLQGYHVVVDMGTHAAGMTLTDHAAVGGTGGVVSTANGLRLQVNANWSSASPNNALIGLGFEGSRIR